MRLRTDDQSDPRKLPDDQQHHDHEHDMMILRTIPLITLPFGCARLKAMPASGHPGFNAANGFAGQARPPRIRGQNSA
ncbi:hypothetical protein ACF1BQ_015145 [Bradyrhizobium sp. RDT10]